MLVLVDNMGHVLVSLAAVGDLLDKFKYAKYIDLSSRLRILHICLYLVPHDFGRLPQTREYDSDIFLSGVVIFLTRVSNIHPHTWSSVLFMAYFSFNSSFILMVVIV